MAGAAERLRPLTAAGLGLVLSLACGGGGGGGGPQPPTTPVASVTFTAAGQPSAGTIYLAQDATGSATRLVLSVEVDEVEGLFGVGFDLEYPSDVLSFESATEGTYLQRGGADTSMQVAEAPAGNLVVGLTRLGAYPGASGSGTLLQLEFSTVASGSGTVVFRDRTGYDLAGTPLQGLRWIGGTVAVVR